MAADTPQHLLLQGGICMLWTLTEECRCLNSQRLHSTLTFGFMKPLPVAEFADHDRDTTIAIVLLGRLALKRSLFSGGPAFSHGESCFGAYFDA